MAELMSLNIAWRGRLMSLTDGGKNVPRSKVETYQKAGAAIVGQLLEGTCQTLADSLSIT